MQAEIMTRTIEPESGTLSTPFAAEMLLLSLLLTGLLLALLQTVAPVW